MSDQFQLLTTKRFLPLFVTQFLGAFNDNVFKNAVVILITFRIAALNDDAIQLLVTTAPILFTLPFLLFSALAGQLADKYERSHLVSIVKFFEIILMMIAAIAFIKSSIFLMMVVLFLVGTQATFFGPLKYALLPDHLKEKELIAGNGLIEAGTFIAILTGTILGGFLILENKGDYLVSSAIIGLAFLGWIASWFIPKTELSIPSLKINKNIFAETYNILKYAKIKLQIYRSILGISWFWAIGYVYLGEFSIYGKITLHVGQPVITLFFALFTVGIALGSLLCNVLLKGKIHATYVPLASIGMTIFTIDLYFASQHTYYTDAATYMGILEFISHFSNWRILFDLLLIAVFGGIYIVPLYAILQEMSEVTHRARVIASNNIINAIFMFLAGALTWILLTLHITITQIFLIMAIANGLVALYICKLLPEAIVKSVLKWLFQMVYRVEVIGMENYENAGKRVVIVANHASFLDAALLAAFLPDKLTFAINTYTAKKRWIKYFVKVFDLFQIDPTNAMSTKGLIEYIKKDKKCVIFPEGRISVTGALMKIYEGPGLVADKSHAKLLPIRIQGAQFSQFSRLRGKVKIHWFPKITLKIFPAQSFSVPENIKGRKRRQMISMELYDVMSDMMFASSNYQQTLFTGLIHAMKIHGRHHITAEDIERKPVSLQQMIMRSFILGSKIASISKRQQIIGVLLPNSVGAAIVFFALQAYARVPAMINYSGGIKNILSACKTGQITQIYTSKRFVRLAHLSDVVKELENQNIEIVYLEEITAKISLLAKVKGALAIFFPQTYYRYVSTENWRKQKTPNPQSPAVVLFTSGSEGTPKGVVLSHANIQANIYQLLARIDLTPSDSVFNALPIFHSFGLTGGMLMPMLAGLRVFFYPSPLHYRIVPELSYDANATILFGTDTFLSNYARYAHPYDFYSVRYVFAGAEKVKESTRKLWSQKFGVRLLEGYGTTETSPVLAANTPMQSRVGTVGRLLPKIRYQLKPIEGIHEGGELLVAGPNIMLGYLRSEAPGVIQPPKDGWHETGDIVTVDEAGFVTIVGRIKRFAKIAGEMVSLGEIENVINEHWHGHHHAIISISDAKRGEQIILITTKPEASREDLIKYFKEKGIAEISIPKSIVYLEKLPFLATGKTDYVKLKEIIESQ